LATTWPRDRALLTVERVSPSSVLACSRARVRRTRRDELAAAQGADRELAAGLVQALAAALAAAAAMARGAGWVLPGAPGVRVRHGAALG
jgi:hypothetical protein